MDNYKIEINTLDDNFEIKDTKVIECNGYCFVAGKESILDDKIEATTMTHLSLPIAYVCFLSFFREHPEMIPIVVKSLGDAFFAGEKNEKAPDVGSGDARKSA